MFFVSSSLQRLLRVVRGITKKKGGMDESEAKAEWVGEWVRETQKY